MIVMDMHLHSNFSDGNNTVEEMTEKCIQCGYTHIAFTDHVRRESNWIDDYLILVDKVRKKYKSKIQIYSGVEAKVIDTEGNIDLDPKYYGKLDLILAAFHRIPLGNDKYIRATEAPFNKVEAFKSLYLAMINVIRNPYVNIIAHPTAIFNRANILVDNTFINFLTEANKYKKYFEINIKYDFKDKYYINLLRKMRCNISIGSDSHSIDQLELSKDDIKYACLNTDQFKETILNYFEIKI